MWAVGERGEVYRYKEIYGCTGVANVGVKLSPGEIAMRIEEGLRDERREGIRTFGVADPSIWDGSRGTSVYEQMRAASPGLYFAPAVNARIPGKAQVHERLKFDAAGRPMMQVFTTCRDFIRTFPALVYDGRRVEDIDTEGEDHIYDETRYFLMSRPIAPGAAQAQPRAGYDPLG